MMRNSAHPLDFATKQIHLHSRDSDLRNKTIKYKLKIKTYSEIRKPIMTFKLTDRHVTEKII